MSQTIKPPDLRLTDLHPFACWKKKACISSKSTNFCLSKINPLLSFIVSCNHTLVYTKWHCWLLEILTDLVAIPFVLFCFLTLHAELRWFRDFDILNWPYLELVDHTYCMAKAQQTCLFTDAPDRLRLQRMSHWFGWATTNCRWLRDTVSGKPYKLLPWILLLKLSFHLLFIAFWWAK